jgi:hypothetical protein
MRFTLTSGLEMVPRVSAAAILPALLLGGSLVGTIPAGDGDGDGDGASDGDRPVAVGEDQEEAPSLPGDITYGEPKMLCRLAVAAVNESSGIACSRRDEGVFWTHNDSGDDPCIHAFDLAGKDLGSFELEGAEAIDWEDIASFRRGRRGYLLLADTGNNTVKREEFVLYLVQEPRRSRSRKPRRGTVAVEQTIRFQCDDGANDIEAVAVDPESETIYLASKHFWPITRIYALPIPQRSRKQPVTAKRIALISTLAPTAMDISPDGRRLILLTYAHALEFTRSGEETWAQALARTPRKVEMPERDQGEAICYGGDGKTLYLTSEGESSPLWEVPVGEPTDAPAEEEGGESK